MNVDLNGRCALVTGGGTGIGRGLSLGLARNGAAVVVNYSKSRDEAEATVEEIRQNGGKAVPVRADVTQGQQVVELVQQCLAFVMVRGMVQA